MTGLLIALIVVLAVALAALAARHRQHRDAPGQAAPGRDGDAPDPVPVREQRPVAPGARRRAAPGERRGRDARAGVPRPRAAPPPARLPAAAPVRGGGRAAGGDRAPRGAVRRRRSTRASQRGRTQRHALREAIAQERFDRIVIAAAAHGGHGFDPDDVAWLLDNAEGEIVVLRPDKDDRLNGNGKHSSARRRTPQRRRAGIGGPASMVGSPVAR